MLLARQPDDKLAPLLFDGVAGVLYLSVVSRLIDIVYNTQYAARAVAARVVRPWGSAVTAGSALSHETADTVAEIIRYDWFPGSQT